MFFSVFRNIRNGPKSVDCLQSVTFPCDRHYRHLSFYQPAQAGQINLECQNYRGDPCQGRCLLMQKYFCPVYGYAGKTDLSKGYWNPERNLGVAGQL